MLVQAESLAVAGTSADDLAAVRCQMVDNLRMQGRYEEARRTLEAADSLLRPGSEPSVVVGCLSARSSLSNEAGPNEEAVA